MNHGIYRLIFNRERGAWMAAAEFVRGHGKGGRPGRRLALAIILAVTAFETVAAPRLPAGTVPVPVNAGGAGFVSSGAASYAAPVAGNSGNALTITQTSQKAVLNWASFNIAAGSSVNFSHPAASASTLNRIGSADPSVIQGVIRSTARDTGGVGGTVYLINRNGILFDKGSQINVGGLVAATLDIADSVFENGLLSIGQGTDTRVSDPVFSWGGSAAQFQTSVVRVEAGAEIQTSQEGRVMLLAPIVENRGSIATPQGQTILAAGAKVYLASPVSGSRLRGFLVEVDPFVGTDAGGQAVTLAGSVTNKRPGSAELAGDAAEINTSLRANGVISGADLSADELAARVGRIVAERGNITLAALAVNQQGLLKATTSVDLNGSIYLQARDTAIPGIKETASDGSEVYNPLASRMGALNFSAGSTTEVSPDTTSSRTLRDDQTFNRSEVRGIGKTIVVENGAAIVARSGDVNLTAQDNLTSSADAFGALSDDTARVYVGAGSRIDVSGLRNVDLSVERNVIEVELRGNEFKDFPLQRKGVLAGQKVLIDIREGTPLADVSGYIAEVQRGIAEKSAAGGSIVLKSEGDAIVRNGASLDVSGGNIAYRAGDTGTTRLIADGQGFSIGKAPADLSYTSFIKDTYRYEAGYLEGRNAGAVAIYGSRLALDGSLVGGTVAGIYQRDVAKRPLGGKLTLGKWALAADGSAVLAGMTSSVRFANGGGSLPATFGAGDALPSIPLLLDSGIFAAGGFTRLQLASANRVDVPAEIRINAGPGGDLSITGRSIDVEGTVATPGGKIALTTLVDGSSGNPADFALRLGSSAQVTAAGTVVSDSIGMPSGNGSEAVVLKGGSVTLKSAADLDLAAGSRIDVSGGAWLQANGKFKFGDAGSITLTTGTMSFGPRPEAPMILAGALAGYGLSDGVTAASGGGLDITTSNIHLGGNPTAQAGELQLDDGFFATGGFRNYNIIARDNLAVAADATIRPAPASLVFKPIRGAGLPTLGWSSQLLREDLRATGSLKLSTLSADFGDLLVGTRANLSVDAGGTIALTAARSMHVDGTLDAAGGSVSLAQTEPNAGDQYLADRVVWLGSSARLLASGYTRLTPNAIGLRQGSVAGGGSIAINAARGYLVAEHGAELNVAGTSATLDILGTEGGRTVRRPTLVGSSGGSISLAAREGMLLDGELRAQGDGGALGGALSVIFDGGTTPWLSFDPILYSQINGPRRLVLTQSANAGTSGILFGQQIDTATRNGIATIDADKVEAGGFADVALNAENRIEIDGIVSLTTQRSIRLDTPNLLARSAAAATFKSGIVGLGNSQTERQGTIHRDDATAGSGTLTANARSISLAGNLTLQGFGTATLNSAGDISTRGVVTQKTVNDATVTDYTGVFVSGGDIALNASRIFPSTLSDFAVEVNNNSAGTIRIGHPEGWAGNDGPVLSAGGRLVFAAPRIEQDGTVKAPFGSIEMLAQTITRQTNRPANALPTVTATRTNTIGGTVTLGSHSATSVAGEAQTIPMGKTELSGQEWVYQLGSANRTLALAPAKRILLDADTVTVAGGKINLAGGGEMLAWEFLPGTGGSKDVLDPTVSPRTYAILPSLKGSYAPFDLQSWSGTTGLTGGDSIVLDTAVGGLGGGTYALLPARYALLPGAYTITFTGSMDAKSGQVQAQPGGGWLAAATRATETRSGIIASPRSELVNIAPGDVARSRSEYIETTASLHFAGGSSRLPGDAGQLAVHAGTSLALGGSLDTTFAGGHRGAEVDIAANKLAVVAHSGSDYGNGYMTLAADTLNQLGAASLALGGIRERDANGTNLKVGASDVVIDNAGTTLSAPDVILAATGTVSLAENAIIAASGGAPSETLRVIGDGALLRVSGNGLGDLVRTGTTGTTGTLDVKAGATLAGVAVTLDATKSNTFSGVFGKTPSGVEIVTALALGANRISLGAAPVGTTGLTLNDSRLGELSRIETLRLKSYSTLDLYGATTFGAQLNTLDIQAAGIAGFDNAGQTAKLAADNIALSNPEGIVLAAAPAPTLGSSLKLTAANTLTLGVGAFTVEGFSKSTLRAEREIVASNSGSHDYAGKLILEAGRITATSDARQKITATGALITSTVAQPQPFSPASAGGQISLSGTTLDHGGKIDLPSGKIALTATMGDLNLLADSQLNAPGKAIVFADLTVFASGGQVLLDSRNANVIQASSAAIDISGATDVAANGGHAGSLAITAAGNASLTGPVAAAAGSTASRGGRFSLDAGNVADLTMLAGKLNSGGFSQGVAVRARNGNMTLDAGTTLKSSEVLLAADNGNLTVAGTIDASGSKGGSIETYAGRGNTTGSGILTLTGALKANGTETLAVANGTRGQGGDVTLGVSAADASLADQARLILRAGSSIDVDAASGSAARGGKVVMRAPRVGTSDVAISGAADGSLTSAVGTGIGAGASSVAVEGLRIYSTTGNLSIDAAKLATWKADTATFMGNAAALKTRLGWTNAIYHVRPGIEARATGNITLATDWDFQKKTGTVFDWRYLSGTEPGFLTLRAGGNLNLNAALSDGFVSQATTAALVPAQDSWAYRIVAGANTNAATLLDLQRRDLLNGSGNIALAAAKLVRTGTGNIDIAAGNNLTAGDARSVIYTAGKRAATISTTDFAAIDSSNNPSFPTEGGDLDILAQGDISFVRGTQTVVDWLYRQGRLQANGTLGNTANGDANNTAWWLNFPAFAQGVGALGGGDASVAAGGGITGLSVSTPTNARLKGAANTLPNAANLVTQGGGDVNVSAGGDILNGVFYAATGNLDLVASGAVGKAAQGVTLALGSSQLQAEAGQGLAVNKVIDPFLTPQATGNISGTGLSGNTKRITYFSAYETNSSISLTSLSGDVSLGIGTVAPPTLWLVALNGSISLTGGAFTMAPAALGNLDLLAANAIRFDNSSLAMSDAPLSALAPPIRPQQVLGDAIAIGAKHSSPVLHDGDPQPVRIIALNGNIDGYLDANSLTLPKRAIISAGGSIANLGVAGQNLAATDVSRIEAGGDLVFESTRNSTGGLATNTKTIEWGGPGRLEISAGGDIDLGSSKGVVTRGNLGNAFLPEGGAAVSLRAGATTGDYGRFLAWLEAPAQASVRDLAGLEDALTTYMRNLTGNAVMTPAAARIAFGALGETDRRVLLDDVFYAVLRAVGRRAAVADGTKDYGSGYDAIAELFPTGAYEGGINMYYSQIKTEQGGGIDLMAPGGRINAGLAVNSGLSKGASELGIVTARGGSVRAFVRDEFAVNQSRVFTLQGGDILIWSSEGDIDAGKGSKTAAATPPPQIIVRGDKIILDTSNSVSGSGIGVLLGKEGVAAGAVDLIAPKGTVIAGEAGIRATGDVFIPGKVSGADNIQAGGSKVGVPQVEVASAAPPPPPPPTDTGKAGERAVASSAAGGGTRDPGANSILTVDVLGVGDDDDDERKRRNN